MRIEALRHRPAPDAVRRQLRGIAVRRQVRDRISTLLEAGVRPRELTLVRAKLKPGRKLSAYFDVGLEDADRRWVGNRAIAVTWTAGEMRDADEAAARRAMSEEAMLRDVAGPFRSLTSSAGPGRADLVVAPLDVRFPQLVRMYDASYLVDALPVSVRDGWRVTAVRYRPRQRHVLRYEPRGSTVEGTVVFAKLFVDEGGSTSFTVASHLADAFEEHAHDLRALRPLAYLPADRTLLYRSLAGTTLSTMLDRSSHGAGPHLRQAGRLLSALQQVRPVASMAPRSLECELAATERASEHIVAMLPGAKGRLHALLGGVREAGRRIPQDEQGFAHGDVKTDHLWVDGEVLTLIDLDSCAVAEPGYDLGKLLADVRFRLMARGRSGVDGAQSIVIDGWRTAGGSGVLARARLFEVVWFVKIASRRLPVFDPDWSRRAGAALGLAEAMLAQLTSPRAWVRTRAGIRSARPSPRDEAHEPAGIQARVR
jgi:aminoglycoside phosphotransferase (APT) family kinase protein